MKKKIAILTTHPIQYYAPLFRLLAKSEHLQVKVFYTAGHIPNRDKDFGIPITWDIPLLEGYDYVFCKNISTIPGTYHFLGIVSTDLFALITDYKPDSMLIFGYANFTHLAAIIYFYNKIPLYFRGDSTLLDVERNWLKKIAKRALLPHVFRCFSKVLYVGENNKAYFEAYGVPQSKLVFVPHCVDNAFFAHYQSQNSIREKLGIPQNATLVLFAGKFTHKKAPEILIKSVIALKHPQIHLLLVGNGSKEGELKRLAAFASNIHFMPFKNQSEMPEVYHSCNIFCLPSRGPGETWGLAVNEAMAAGKAIIVSNKCGCFADLVRHGTNGFVFDSENISQLSAYILHLHQNENYKAFGQRSLEIIAGYDLFTARDAIYKSFF